MFWSKFLKIIICAFMGVALIILIVDACLIGGWTGFLTFVGGAFILLISISAVMIYIHISETLDKISENINELSIQKLQTTFGSAKTQTHRIHTTQNALKYSTNEPVITLDESEELEYDSINVNKEDDGNDLWFCTKCGGKNNGGTICNNCFVSR